MRDHQRTQRHAGQPRSMKRPSTSPSTNLMITAPLGTSPAKDRPRCAGRYTKQRSAPASRPAPTAPTTSSSPPGSAGTAPASRSRANCSNAATTSSKLSATRHSHRSPNPPVTRQGRDQPMNRGQLPARLLPTRPGGNGPERMSGRNTICRNNRGRDHRCRWPPAQIPACASNALGSSLGFWRRSARSARDGGCAARVASDRRGVACVPR